MYDTIIGSGAQSLWTNKLIVRNHQEVGRRGGGFKKFHEMFVLVDIRWACSCKGG